MEPDGAARSGIPHSSFAILPPCPPAPLPHPPENAILPLL
jgi:hypothetical protein